MFTKAVPTEAAKTAEDEIKLLLERARGGDAGALPALRAALDGRPEFWRSYGDLAAHARDAWIGVIAGPDVALHEALRRTAAAMLGELAGPGASPLEQLLAERIVVSWLETNYCDAAAARSAGASIRQAAFALKRQESAGRRHVMTIGALATLRRLLPTTVALAAPAPAAGLADPETADVPTEADGERTVAGPGELADVVAGGESDGASRVIPFKPRQGARRVRGA